MFVTCLWLQLEGSSVGKLHFCKYIRNKLGQQGDLREFTLATQYLYLTISVDSEIFEDQVYFQISRDEQYKILAFCTPRSSINVKYSSATRSICNGY